MRIRPFTILFVLALCCRTALGMYQWDFEHGLDGWLKTGNAFDKQPVAGATIHTDSVKQLVKLNGDYWQDLPYPVGQRGKYLVFTEDEAQGTLTSKPFILSGTERYFSFRIGGSADAAHERLELQVLVNSPSEAASLEKQIREWAGPEANLTRLPPPLGCDGDYVLVVVATGQYGPEKSLLELLRQEVVEIPEFLVNRTARLCIADASPTAHINVDAIAFSERPPEPYREPVWGYADYHTHPMTYWAFGGTRGSHLLFGSPGGRLSDYYDPGLIGKDIPYCETSHGRGPAAEAFINQIEERIHLQRGAAEELRALITGQLKNHDRSGGLEFRNFPSFLSGAHQQMHITQIRRNYDGGLRLMVAYATHNRGAEYLTSKLEIDNHIKSPSEDRESVEAQIAATKKMAEANSEWMEIAYDPDVARRIIRENKLAVVLGIEVDQLGQLNVADPEFDEVDYLWDLGIRAVVPVHGSNNKLGTAAVWRDEYNWLNDFLSRTNFDLTVEDLKKIPAEFFEVRDGSCKKPVEQGECVSFKLKTKQMRLVIKKKFPLGLTPFPEEVDWPEYANYRGHKNKYGLSEKGKSYIDRLMDRGMIIDTAHMSDLSVKHVYERVELRLQGDPECKAFSFDQNPSNLDALCYGKAYPIIVSHAHFRAQSFYNNKTFVERSRPSEYQIGRHNLDLMSRVGGVVGPFVSERPLELPDDQPPSPFKNDCSMSSKGFGLSFSYALKKMGGHGVGMATDFTFIPGVAPRFGENACWGFNLADKPGQERIRNSSLYDKGAQNQAVVYEGIRQYPGVKYGHNPPLVPYRMGTRKPFDFNFDGLAHFGMVPDMLQDLKNLGMPASSFQSLFSSAESYLQMWQKAWDAPKRKVNAND